MARIRSNEATETPIIYNQLNDLWQQFCDLDEEVEQAALPLYVSMPTD